MVETLRRRCADLRIVPGSGWADFEIGNLDEEDRRQIAQHGLTRPIGINDANEVVFGEGVLRACRELDWVEIPVKIVDLDGIIAGKYSPDALRQEFAPEERAGVRRAILRRVLPSAILAALSPDR
jgi:hypothetical protein